MAVNSPSVPAHPVACDTIRFVLDGEIISICNPDPTRTVLQYLRDDLRRTGTKEGCAEGDCGACTVVLLELDRTGNELRVRAINSCIQFLPTLDGKELLTVESLSSDGKRLHPVQQALVDCHGSQCGFCTPGFVMSLFALYKSEACAAGRKPGRREIDDTLAGNLCRCTGYRPIIAAAQQMSDASRTNVAEGWLAQPSCEHRSSMEKVAQLRNLRRDSGLQCAHAGRRFIAPQSIAELSAALAANPGATLLAGGTDVGLWVTKQYRELGPIIYIGAVSGLDRIVRTSTHLEIGSAATLSDAVPVIIREYPVLDELFRRFASPPIRNAATLGGNIANGSPIGDSMPALMVLGTTLLLNSSDGQREISLDDFYQDYMVNALRPGEFVESVQIPLAKPGALFGSYKVSKRFDQDISCVCAAFYLTQGGDGIATARVAFGGLSATIKRAKATEQALLGKAWNEATVAAGMVAMKRDFTPLTDMRASAAYRMRVAQNLLRRFYLETGPDARFNVYEYGRED